MALWVRAVQLVTIAGIMCCIKTGYRIFSLPIITSPQGKFMHHQSYFWYMEKVFMYSYNKLTLKWSELFTCSKKLGENITHSQGKNISPLLCSWAGMWSHLGSASLQQSCPLHRASPLHLCRLNSCPRLWGPDFLEGQWGTQKVWKEICFTARQSGRCGLDTGYLSSHNL